MELETGAPAAGGGCVARAPDGRVVFVRHALPGERVVAEVTAETASFLRADAVAVLSASPDRVAPPCRHAGPGRCGGCDWQHVALPAQRRLKEQLVAEQLRRVAGDTRSVVVEPAPGETDGMGWRTRVRFSVDRSGRIGLRRHRSHEVEPVASCPVASDDVNGVDAGRHRWRGARTVEVAALPARSGGGPSGAVVTVTTARGRPMDVPRLDAGCVVDGRTVQEPGGMDTEVLGHRYRVSGGVFWQAHRGAPAVLASAVLDGLEPMAGERTVDLYAGAGLFTLMLADAVGASGSVLAVERNARACEDLTVSARGFPQVSVLRAAVDADLVASRIGSPDLVVLDPAREGAGRPVMASLRDLRPSPRRVAYVSCDAATFARDLRVLTDAGWTMPSLRAFDLFPMTEHVELVGVLVPPVTT